jgi:hypothetical protein
VPSKSMSAASTGGLHNDNDDDPDEEASSGDGGDDNYCCVSEKVYVECGNEKKVLYLMCIGLTHRNNNSNEAQLLFSFEQEPWSLLLAKNSFLRPKNSDFVHEITRRAHLFNLVRPLPCPSKWSRVQILEWLEQNPIQNVADIEFLTKEVFRLQVLLIRAQQQWQGIENNSITSAGGGRGGGERIWQGNFPYLRVIMCLTQDNVKSLFVAKANTR